VADGPIVDDGTARIGIFSLMQRGELAEGHPGLATDDWLRCRTPLSHGGLNLFPAGVIERAGGRCWSLDDVKARLLAWKHEL
jgi:hypothetical protein